MKNVWRSNTKTWTALCRGRTNVINFRFHSGLGHFLISKAFKYLSKKMPYQYDLYPVAFLTLTFSYHLEKLYQSLSFSISQSACLRISHRSPTVGVQPLRFG